MPSLRSVRRAAELGSLARYVCEQDCLPSTACQKPTSALSHSACWDDCLHPSFFSIRGCIRAVSRLGRAFEPWHFCVPLTLRLYLFWHRHCGRIFATTLRFCCWRAVNHHRAWLADIFLFPWSFSVSVTMTWPNPASSLTRRERRGCHRCVPYAGPLCSGR